MADIFISYAREDREWVEALSEALELLGYSTWWDRRIDAGSNFDEVIDLELEKAKCVVVLWSNHSVKSRWVKTEANEGMGRDILIPVLIEDVKQPLMFRLVQTVSLVGWNRTGRDRVFDTVADHIRRLVTKKEIFDTSASLDGKSPTKSALLPSTFTNDLGMEFVLIEPGIFMMGSDKGNADEKPIHEVEITTPFYLGKYPVTQYQWQSVIGDNPSRKKGADLPVTSISWNETQVFIEKLNNQGEIYRLPTEAEWEYACRAGTDTEYFFGDDPISLDRYAVYCDNPLTSLYRASTASGIASVGNRKPNPWGLYDILGNVWEWVNDYYAPGYYKNSPAKNPKGPHSGTYRVSRGGSFYSDSYFLRCGSRNNYGSDIRHISVGFRAVALPNAII